MSTGSRFFKHLFFLCISLTFGAILIACGPVTKNGTNQTPPVSGYPNSLRTSENSIEGYPVATINSQGIMIGLNKPLVPGDTSITGFGPAGLSIQIINITFMGEELGSGIVGEDGTFSIPVGPLSDGIRIGLRVDLDSVNLTNEDIVPGDEAINVPQVGYFVDSFVIR